MSDNAQVLVLSAVILCVSLAGFVAALLYSVPLAYSRLRSYTEPGPRRTYARYQFVLTLIPTLGVLFMLAAGAVALVAALEVGSDHTWRIIIRYCIVASVILWSGQLLVVPLSIQRVEDEVRKEGDANGGS